MRRIPQVLIHCAYVAALIDVGACSSEDGLGASAEVQAAGDSHELLSSKKHHEKKKRKHHWEDCAHDAGSSDGDGEDAGTPVMCLSLALKVDSLKHREDTQKLERKIDVLIPETLDAFYVGKKLEAELTLQQGDKRVTCSYKAHSHRGGASQALEFQSCDNGAKAGDSITIDSATLRLDCSWQISIAKVWVELDEIEPCGEEPPPPPQCDPAKVDDKNACTLDVCGSNGVAQHEPLPSGTSCSDNNVCNGEETCDGQGACKPGTPTPPSSPQPGACETLACVAPGGWVLVPKAVGTSCADNNICNGNETCNSEGQCGDGIALACRDTNMCNGEETCDATRGCLPGTPLVIDNDNEECTIDECDPSVGVRHRPVDNGRLCHDAGGRCTDGVCVDFS